MDNITEEDLTKELNGGQDVESTGILADLEAEFKEEEQKPEEPAQEETPAEEPAQEEPASEEKPAEEQPEEKEPVEEEPAQEPELILGKFKSQDDLINAYKNLEKKMGEKAQEVKEVQRVQSDDFDRAVIPETSSHTSPAEEGCH